MKRHMNRLQIVLPIAGVLALGTTACQGSTGTDESSPVPMPAVPPSASIRLDVSFFRQHTPGSGGSTSNWSTALDRAAFADSAFASLLELPFATFASAVASSPAPDGDMWRWSYTVLFNGQSYSGSIRGGRAGAQNAWSLTTTAPGVTPPVSNRVLFTGESAIFPLSAGRWFIYPLTSASSDPAVRIDWTLVAPCILCLTLTRPAVSDQLTHNQNSQSRELRYFAVDPTRRFYMWWNPTTGEGGVSVAEGSIMCWDTQQRNRAC